MISVSQFVFYVCYFMVYVL